MTKSEGFNHKLRACVLIGVCARSHGRHHQVVAYSSDLTDDQWKILEPLLLVSSKRGPKHGDDLRHVVDAMLYISHTGCQWRFLPGEFGPWTRVWSQFRRWSRNGTWARVLTGQEAPLAPGVRNVEHCVDDVAQVGAVLRSSFGGNQQQRFQYLPRVIGQVTRIGHDLMVTVAAPGAHANKDTRS